MSFPCLPDMGHALAFCSEWWLPQKHQLSPCFLLYREVLRTFLSSTSMDRLRLQWSRACGWNAFVWFPCTTRIQPTIVGCYKWPWLYSLPACNRIGSSRPSSIASAYTNPRVVHTLEVAIEYTSSSICPAILVRNIIASWYYLANKLLVRLLDGRSTCFVCPCTQTLGKRFRCILVHECWSSPLHTSVTCSVRLHAVLVILPE